MTPLNLASRPVRNERVPALLFAVATLLLLGASVQHALLVRRLLPRRSAALREEVVVLRHEMESLQSQAQAAKRQPVSRAQLAEWKVIRDLVDKRTFWWSQLFASFEDVLPRDVRIVSVSPMIREGQYDIELSAKVPTKDAGLRFVKMLEDRPEFSDVYPVTVAEEQGAYTVTYKMHYAAMGNATRSASDVKRPKK